MAFAVGAAVRSLAASLAAMRRIFQRRPWRQLSVSAMMSRFR